ncbi:hypothetical protein MTR_3g107750 [Medicago truncatula]|uniref:ATP-dependent DNA helicase PIF1 n=1 Tax=Medicago truncatula TaxID=3880 RepID=G7JBM6_MEDTR|nr:hypothetical protein MTR_3g107750 [Medicago truncatula]
MLVVAEINDVVHDETMSSDIIFELDDNQDVDIDCDENGKIDDVPDNDYDYFDVGEPAFVCRWCKEVMWYEERVSKHRNTSIPEFSMCCMQGRIEISPFGKLSQPLHDPYFKNNRKIKFFSKTLDHLIACLPLHRSVQRSIKQRIMAVKFAPPSASPTKVRSLKQVDIYLPPSVFSHGQQYVAISRVTLRDGLKIIKYC